VIHVVWLGQDPERPGVWYTRSTDGGRSFAPERNVLDTRTECQSATVAADPKGNVWIFWLDGRLPAEPGSVMAAPIFMARSHDDGATFGPDERVRHDHPGLACACCRLEARTSADGYLYLSFRSAYRNLRDVFLLRSPRDRNDFHAIPIHGDRWLFAGCPGSGVPFTLEEDGRVLASWMSRGRVFWALSDRGGSRFGPPVAAPPGSGRENYPLALANRDGTVLLAWKDGPRLCWAIYEESGRFTGRSGVAGETTGADKPMAFVGRDGRFHLVL
jgi:hypothetical protein